MQPQRHWHGFATYIGSADLVKKEEAGIRLAGKDLNPNDPATRMFIASDMPPVHTGHYLLRRQAVSAGRTWLDVEQCLQWLCQQYERHPPSSPTAYLPLEARVEHTRTGLTNGADSMWWYYTPSFSIAVTSAICCPNTFFPEIACPLPPPR
jgi:hypothetical protein